MYSICIKDLISISGVKFHYIISTVKFYTQFEKKTIVPMCKCIYFKYIYRINFNK